MPSTPARLRRELGQFIRENGIQWTALFCLSRILRGIGQAADQRLMTLEQTRQLPGINTVERNRELWNGYDWTERGENWSPSPEWKQALVDDVMRKYLREGADVLEIGPGGGRWTEFLQRYARRLTLIDVSPRCLELCRQRFADATNIEYVVGTGSDLRGIADASIDFIWSFDVFVHVSPGDTEGYLMEFRRVMRPGAYAIIHHPKRGRAEGGYRSSTTAELFTALVKKHDLRFISQFDSWGPHGEFDVRLHADAITVFAS